MSELGNNEKSAADAKPQADTPSAASTSSGPASDHPASDHPASHDLASHDPASDDAASHDPASHDPASHNPASGSRHFQLGNVLKLVVPLVILGGGIFLFVGVFDGAGWISRRMNPPLVKAAGRVMYQGKPLEGAQVSTRHANGKLTPSIGWTDAEGRFTLRTDLNGYVDGAFAGEHQVVVTAYQLTATASAPPLVTPEKYASFASTPLRIVVSRVPEENEYTLTLEGDPPQRASASRGGGGGPPGGGFDPETMVGRVFENYDQDKDDRLSAEELQAIQGGRGDRIRQADANQDGVVEREELKQAMTPPE